MAETLTRPPSAGVRTNGLAPAMPPQAQEEARLGGTPAGRAASAALTALARTARSFLMYEPRNEAVRQFLADLREKMCQAVELGGALAIEVQPFALVRQGEMVYLERDRERSLAFRMFRDGVRRVTIEPEVSWEELLRLLEILSIRYTGIRQQEDDIVTLLCKAGFQHISIEAVEGFVPDEEQSEGGAATGTRRTAAHIEAPPDWDLPLPPRREPGALEHRHVPPEQCASLQAEESSHALPASAVRLIIEMLAAVADPADPTTIEEVLPSIGETRDFLLAEGQLAHLTRLVRALAATEGHEREPVASMLASFGDERALRRILHSVPRGQDQAPPELVEFLDLLPADHLAHLVDLLAVERGEASRRIARQLIERYAPARPDYVISRLEKADSGVAGDLLLACARALPERAVEAALKVKDHPDVEVQIKVLEVLETAPYGTAAARALLGMVGSPLEEVRIRAVELLVKHKEQRAFDALVRHVEGQAAHDLTPREAEAIGQAMACLSPAGAWRLFSEWTRPKGLLKRFVETPGHRMLQWTAAAGSSVLPGGEAEKLIREVLEHSADELHRYCVSALVRRRRGAGGPASGSPAGRQGASHG